MKWIVTILVVLFSGMIGFQIYATEKPIEESEKDQPSWKREPLTIDIGIKTRYLDGQEKEEWSKQTIWSMEDFWNDYAGYEVTHQEEGEITFIKNVEDISPETKQKGRIGLNQNGEITLYHGSPLKSKAVHSYFQIDVDALESYQFDQLEKGIPVPNKETFLKVMETYTQQVSATPNPK